MTRLPRTIVIVGAGFSGAAVAINLLRLSYWRPSRIVLVDRAPRMARGAAYAERSHPYLLNVPAGRMSMNSSDPLEFLKFAQGRLPDATEDDFLPRALYGEYLESVLLEAETASPAHVQLHKVRGEVCGIERTGGTSPFRIELDDGTSFVADDVVLALGNPPPAESPRDAVTTRISAVTWISALRVGPLGLTARVATRGDSARHRHRPHHGGYRHSGK